AAHALGAAGQRQRRRHHRDRAQARARCARALRRAGARRHARRRSPGAQALRRRRALRASSGLPLLCHATREARLERGARQVRVAMLRALEVRDFVLIERASLEPGDGFTTLTGETGAGKSLLVDALELLVGGRGDATLVREGAGRAELSGEFDVSPG